MIYLSIPKGYIYERKMVEYNINGEITHELKDVFADPLGKNDIVFQDIVLEKLRNNRGKKKVIEAGEFTIYRFAPPVSTECFLAYKLKNNGKCLSDSEPEVVQGVAVQKYKPNSLTSYGSFWHENMYLTAEKKEQIFSKMEEQRQNRRHMQGDCPNPT